MSTKSFGTVGPQDRHQMSPIDASYDPISGAFMPFNAAMRGTALTYSASIDLSATEFAKFKLIVTNGTGFTINAPVGGVDGQRITFVLHNTSGGACGAITWNAIYSLPAAFSGPGNGLLKTISFVYDGAATKWVQD